MDKKFLVKLASKNLSSHRLRTVLTVTAMIIGVSAIVFLVSFAFGLEKLVSREVSGGNAYQMVDVGTGDSAIIKLNEDALTKLSQISGVKQLEATANAAAKYNLSGQELDSSFFVTSAQYFNWLGETIRYGSVFSEQEGSSETVISEYLAEKISSNPQSLVGKQIEFTAIIPKNLSDTGDGKVFDKQIYEISGISSNADSPEIYVSMTNASKYGITDYSQVKIQTVSDSVVSDLRAKVENLGFKTQYLGETISQVQEVFNFFKLILGGFGLIALIVACLGMFNTLTIALLERTKEVALLKILGAKKRDIVSIFLAEAVAIGLLGGLLGVIFGLILTNLANSIFSSYAVRAGGQAISTFYAPLWFVFTVFIFTALIGLLTGIYPARRAAKVDALKVLRYE